MIGDRRETERWKELMNEENEREPRVEVLMVEDQEVVKVSQTEVRRIMKRMKIPVEVWKSLREVAVVSD